MIISFLFILPPQAMLKKTPTGPKRSRLFLPSPLSGLPGYMLRIPTLPPFSPEPGRSGLALLSKRFLPSSLPCGLITARPWDTFEHIRKRPFFLSVAAAPTPGCSAWLVPWPSLDPLAGSPCAVNSLHSCTGLYINVSHHESLPVL